MWSTPQLLTVEFDVFLEWVVDGILVSCPRVFIDDVTGVTLHFTFCNVSRSTVPQ